MGVPQHGLPVFYKKYPFVNKYIEGGKDRIFCTRFISRLGDELVRIIHLYRDCQQVLDFA